MSKIDEVEQQHHALRQGEISEPRDSRGAPARGIEKGDPAEQRERQANEKREPQIEFGSEVEGFEQVRPRRVRERLVERRPENTPERREDDEVDRAQGEQEASESREPIEHFRRPQAA